MNFFIFFLFCVQAYRACGSAIPSNFDAFITSDIAKVVAELAKVEPQYVSLDDLKALSAIDAERQTSLDYARKIVEPATFTHSLRCYYFSLAFLLNNFPSSSPNVSQITFDELNRRLYHTSILHDLGVTIVPEGVNHPASGMSFEIHGGIMAYDQLHAAAPSLDKNQVGDIVQSIMLHTLPLSVGIDSTLGMLLRLSTQFDLLGYDAIEPNSFNIIDRNTVREIEKAFPRTGFGEEITEFFAHEQQVKPNCLTTNLDPSVLARAAALKHIVPPY